MIFIYRDPKPTIEQEEGYKKPYKVCSDFPQQGKTHLFMIPGFKISSVIGVVIFCKVYSFIVLLYSITYI